MDKIKKIESPVGQTKPKICVPLVGKTHAELESQARVIKDTACDIVEWRVDLFHQVADFCEVLKVGKALKDILFDIPILFTFRTVKEGGKTPISDQDYLFLNTSFITTGLIDFIDVELFMGDVIVKEIVQLAHHHNVKVIISNHDFYATPPEDEIINRLCKMQFLGADVPKIAVMPNSVDDLLVLLSATNTMQKHYSDTPVITISMGKLGLLSRLAGEVFGSVMTFAIVGEASAPGQIQLDQLKPVLDLLHEGK